MSTQGPNDHIRTRRNCHQGQNTSDNAVQKYANLFDIVQVKRVRGSSVYLSLTDNAQDRQRTRQPWASVVRAHQSYGSTANCTMDRRKESSGTQDGHKASAKDCVESNLRVCYGLDMAAPAHLAQGDRYCFFLTTAQTTPPEKQTSICSASWRAALWASLCQQHLHVHKR